MTDQTRQPKGVREGGQFAASKNPEANTVIDVEEDANGRNLPKGLTTDCCGGRIVRYATQPDRPLCWTCGGYASWDEAEEQRLREPEKS